MPNDLQTILLEDHSYIQINSQKAAGVVSPGMILERNTGGNFDPHSGADGSWAGYIACEDELQGKTVDQDYTTDEIIRVAVVRRGDRVNALLADDESVSIGDKLVSNGDGTVRKIDESSANLDVLDNAIVGEADEALDLSGGSSAESSAMWGNQRLTVRVW